MRVHHDFFFATRMPDQRFLRWIRIRIQSETLACFITVVLIWFPGLLSPSGPPNPSDWGILKVDKIKYSII